MATAQGKACGMQISVRTTKCGGRVTLRGGPATSPARFLEFVSHACGRAEARIEDCDLQEMVVTLKLLRRDVAGRILNLLTRLAKELADSFGRTSSKRRHRRSSARRTVRKRGSKRAPNPVLVRIALQYG